MDSLFGLKTQLKEQDEDNFEVEYEILSPINMQDIIDSQKKDIMMSIQSVDEQLDIYEQKIEKLNTEIERLTNHADGLDYALAVASGVLAAAIDVFFVGEFSLERGKQWSDKRVNDIVMKMAKKNGYKGDELQGAIRNLEQFGAPGDSVTPTFGGGKQHHLRDFAHHPTPIGLTFSLLTQFTQKAYGTNTMGVFQTVPIENNSFIGKNLPEKITFGLVYWVFHMASDMAGSNANAGAGTGLPGPILSLVKELSSLPVFNNSSSIQELRINVSKLFNGTLLAKKDENGKILKGPDGKPLIVKFDLRAEMGVAYELGRQAVPIVINEALVRGFYFLRRLIQQLKNKNSLKGIEWKKTIPFSNRTISRMITIASGTFTTIDLVDAAAQSAIKSGGNGATFLNNFILRVNFVGVGRFAIAIVTDVGMEVKRGKLRNERISVMGQQITLLNAKIYYKCAELHCAEVDVHESQAKMWIEAEDTIKTLLEACEVANESMQYCQDSIKEIYKNFERISKYVDGINQYNPDVIRDIINILKWGKK